MALSLHDDTSLADPLDEPWRVARANPVARLRSADLAQRRGGAYSLLRSRLAGDPGISESERAAQDAALVTLLGHETDLSARLTALTALALPLTRDRDLAGTRVAQLRLSDSAPPPLALAALHAFGPASELVDGAQARAGVAPDDDLAAVALDALARRPDAALEGYAVDAPLRWRIMARRGDPSAAPAIVGELGRAAVEVRGRLGMSAIRAARVLRLAEAVPALLAVARSAQERELRRAATEALGDLGGVSTADLVALMEEPVTREPAFVAAARLGDRGALLVVRRYADGDDPGDRAAALAALGRAGASARPVAAATTESAAALERRLLTEVDAGARVDAAMALARRRGVAALPAIEAAAAVAWSAALLDGLSLAASVARDPALAAEP